MSIIDIQRRQRELGRIRMGDKAAGGNPQKLSHFRLTSAARQLLDAAADQWGGEVREWKGAPSEGQYELYTQADSLPIIIPPGPEPVSQWYEQWTAGGCTHRCDGARNHIDESACSCNPDDRACKATTRVNVMLPDLPDVGVWRLESHGINAAYELPGTIDVIQMASQGGRFLTGRLRIEHRTSKKAGQTRKFVVPVIDLDVSVGQLMSGEATAGEIAAHGAQSATDAPALAAGEAAGLPAPPPADENEPAISPQQRGAIFAYAKERNVAPETVRLIARMVLGHGVSEMVKDEVDRLKENVVRFAENEAAREAVIAWGTKNAPELLTAEQKDAALFGADAA